MTQNKTNINNIRIGVISGPRVSILECIKDNRYYPIIIPSEIKIRDKSKIYIKVK